MPNPATTQIPGLGGVSGGFSTQEPITFQKSNGDLYQITMDDNCSAFVHVSKSTDAGATWTDVTQNQFVSANPRAFAKFGDNIYMVNSNTPLGLVLSIYSMVSDSWTTVNSATGQNAITGTRPVSTYAGNQNSVLIADQVGDLHYVYVAETEVINYQAFNRTRYMRYSGGVWTAPVLVPGQAGVKADFCPQAGILGLSGVVHFVLGQYFWTDGVPVQFNGSYNAVAPFNSFSIHALAPGWVNNAFTNEVVTITGGTGSGQISRIQVNTTSSITLFGSWSPIPDATSVFQVFTGANIAKTPLVSVSLLHTAIVAGTPNTLQTIATDASINATQVYDPTGLMVAYNDGANKICIGYVGGGATAGPFGPPAVNNIAIGTDLATPVWTVETFDSTLYNYMNFQSHEVRMCPVIENGVLTMYWVSSTDPAALPLVTSLMKSQRVGGVWAAATTVATYTDTTGTNTIQILAGVTATKLANGSVGIVPYLSLVNIGCPTDLTIQQHVYFSIAGTTLQLVKTVTAGGNKVVADWTLSATGPTSISGAGGVGPSSVTPGTYVLSETVVSGYQARNWVCVGGTQNGNNITLAAGDQVVCTIINDPIPAAPLPATSGGRGFVKVTLNAFNACLGREYLLYQEIDRELLKCGVKPACFCTDERDWGGNFDQHEEVPMGPPGSAIAFNPVGQVALPTALAGDTVIFTFRVPWGYDGVILGQYHGYYGVVSNPPVPGNFVEGSGDIIWRLAIASRFGRDCGQMKVSLGSIRNMAPIAGGLQIRSENIVQYIVAAPNTSGALTPGLGNIVAGIHGWMWPRK